MVSPMRSKGVLRCICLPAASYRKVVATFLKSVAQVSWPTLLYTLWEVLPSMLRMDVAPKML